MSSSPHLRWAVVGVGRAGLARARAIDLDKASKLVALWRGRNADRFPLVEPCSSFDEALSRADAVAICSPDAEHPAQVEAALRAGKHVVCEYPLAPSAREALRLIGLAREVGKVLHVEHIEVLHAPQVILRAHLRSDPPAHISQGFSRTGPDSIPGEELATRNLSRVHRLIDLAGPVVHVADLNLVPGMVSGRLVHRDGAESTFAWEQSPYLQRLTKMTVRTRSGEEWQLSGDGLYRGRMAQTLIEADPLFEQDHRAAMGRILAGRAPYLDDRRVIHGLQVVRRIAEGRAGDVGSA